MGDGRPRVMKFLGLSIVSSNPKNEQSKVVLKLPALIGLLLIFLITGLHIGNINFVQTIKILFYDIYGNYNIKDASLFIKTVKDFYKKI